VVLGPGERLVAYVQGEAGLDSDQRRLLARRLPAYMIPAAFTTVAALPRTPGGKVDRRAIRHLHVRTAEDHAPSEPPSSEAEKRLWGLWTGALGTAPPGCGADFFEAGGDSLRAARLLTLVQREFGRELPLASFLRAPTIAGMALQLEEPPRPAAAQLFCVTARPDAVKRYQALANRLGTDHPLFPILNPVDPAGPPQTVEQLAAAVCRSIRAARPHGPYLLGGYCFGGMVAFEAARQLQESGEEIELLVLFDAPGPNPSWRRRPARLWRKLRERFGIHGDEIERYSARVARRYRASRSDIRAVQFSTRKPAAVRLLGDPSALWSGLCGGGFRMCGVGGSHHDFLIEPHVAELAEKLREMLKGL
jgi:thioesterase domain-containing protein